MSNTYRYASPAVSHFQIPHAIDKYIKVLKVEEFRLLHIILSDAEKYSITEVELSTAEICERTGIHRTNINKTRRALSDYGLIQYREDGKKYTYLVCDPETRVQIPDKDSLTKVDFNLTPTQATAYIKTILSDAKETSTGVKGCCPIPAHDDSSASFGMDVDKGAIWHCRGCGKGGNLISLEMALTDKGVGPTIGPDKAYTLVRDRIRKLGIGKTKRDNPKDVVFPHVDEDGVVVFEVVRRGGDKRKTVVRRQDPTNPDRYIYNAKGCVNPLYNLPAVIEADTVIVVEGHTDADALSQLNLLDDTGKEVAITTNAHGAGSWKPEHSERLRDKRVILCGDNDLTGTGLRHMLEVKAELTAVGVEALTHIILPETFRDVRHFLQSKRPKHFVELVGSDWLEPIEDGVVDI